MEVELRLEPEPVCLASKVLVVPWQPASQRGSPEAAKDPPRRGTGLLLRASLYLQSIENGVSRSSWSWSGMAQDQREDVVSPPALSQGP